MDRVGHTASGPLLFQNTARLGVADEVISILFEEKALAHEFRGALLDCIDIALVILIALLEGLAGIASCQALGLGPRKRNKGAIEAAKVWRPETRCTHIPPDIGPEGHA